MRSVQIESSKTYTATVALHALSDLGNRVLQLITPCNVCIVTDDNVEKLYLSTAKESLAQAGFETSSFVFTHGETNKTLHTISEILEFLADKGFDRSDLILALGGGITGDLAGFAAASYMRGIRYIQVPTSLLAAVDSSVGGKTGVNLSKGKNLAGAFWQPEAVICDPSTFATMPKAQYKDGLAEALKSAVIGDKALFDILYKKNYDIEEVIERCISLKAKIVHKDEKESGVRALLNFGHTVGHAIEKSSDYHISHGHAVSIGMVIMTRAAEKNGTAEKGLTEKLTAALLSLELPIKCNEDSDSILENIYNDKKRKGDSITLVLPEKIGRCTLKTMPVKEALTFIKSGMEQA